MPILYHVAVQQRFQPLQRGAIDDRSFSHAQGGTRGHLQHPQRYLQRFGELILIQSAMRHRPSAPDHYAVHPYRPTEPRVPAIQNLARLGVMGFVLTSCIMPIARMADWEDGCHSQVRLVVHL